MNRAVWAPACKAEIIVEAPADLAAELARLGDDLKFVFITSQATVKQGDVLSVSVALVPQPSASAAGTTEVTSGQTQRTRPLRTLHQQSLRRRRDEGVRVIVVSAVSTPVST